MKSTGIGSNITTCLCAHTRYVAFLLHILVCGRSLQFSRKFQVLNLASYNFTGLAGNETIKERAIETVRKYGVGSCGPPQFYGTIGMSVPS